ncbi:TPA: hypothetical protein ACGPOT_007047, partial [Pseudomonas aeruginosa]
PLLICSKLLDNWILTGRWIATKHAPNITQSLITPVLRRVIIANHFALQTDRFQAILSGYLYVHNGRHKKRHAETPESRLRRDFQPNFRF